MLGRGYAAISQNRRAIRHSLLKGFRERGQRLRIDPQRPQPGKRERNVGVDERSARSVFSRGWSTFRLIDLRSDPLGFIVNPCGGSRHHQRLGVRAQESLQQSPELRRIADAKEAVDGERRVEAPEHMGLDMGGIGLHQPAPRR